MKRRSISGGFRTDLEGLRAVAVALVVLYHAHLFDLSGGYVGVDVFYVLSGFFITGLLVREFERSGRVAFGSFYLRRARRLLPAAAVTLVAIGIAGYLLLPFVRWSTLGWDIVSAALNVANFRFAILSTDYLAQGTDQSAVLHFWSLGVEEQFYLFWPLIVIAFLAWGRHRGTGRSPLVVGILAISALSFAAGLYLTATAQSWSFFMLPTRAWELAAGALLAVLAPRLGSIPEMAKRFIALAGLAAIVVSALVFDDKTPVPGSAMLLPVLGTVAVILGGDADGIGVHTVLRTAPFRAIGRWSYSIYLWHWPLLVFPAIALGGGIADMPIWLRIGLSLASVGCGVLSYLLVERVFRARSGEQKEPKARRTWTARGLALAASCTVVSLAAGTLLVVGTALPGTAPAQAEGPSATTSSAPAAGDSATALRAALAEQTVPATLTPSLIAAADDLPATYGDGCHLDFSGTAFGTCVYGDTAADRSVVLVGDSHAAQWFPALSQLAADEHWKLVSMTKSGCPATAATLPHPTDAGRTYTECRDAHQDIVKRVRALKPDLVLISSLIPFKKENNRSAAAWFSGVSSFASELRTAGAGQVTVLGDTPRPAGNVPDCLAKNLDSAQKCSVATDTAAVPAVEERMRTAADKAGADYQSTTGWLCLDGTCPTIVSDILLYRDDSHLTPPAALWLSGQLASVLPGG